MPQCVRGALWLSVFCLGPSCSDPPCSAPAFSLHACFGRGDLNYESRSESCMQPLTPSGAAVPARERFASAESPRLNRPELFLVPKDPPPQMTSGPPAMEKWWQKPRGSAGSWPWFPAAMLGSPKPPASSLRKLLGHRNHSKICPPEMCVCVVWVELP